MAGCITLEDGSMLWFSNLGLAGFQERLAGPVATEDVEMASWLNDMSQRHSVQDIDLRGLDEHRRMIFWRGSEALYEQTRDWNQDSQFSQYIALLRTLHDRRDVQNELVQGTDIETIDLKERWFPDD
jgi:hypothetical protein